MVIELTVLIGQLPNWAIELFPEIPDIFMHNIPATISQAQTF